MSDVLGGVGKTLEQLESEGWRKCAERYADALHELREMLADRVDYADDTGPNFEMKLTTIIDLALGGIP